MQNGNMCPKALGGTSLVPDYTPVSEISRLFLFPSKPVEGPTTRQCKREAKAE